MVLPSNHEKPYESDLKIEIISGDLDNDGCTVSCYADIYYDGVWQTRINNSYTTFSGSCGEASAACQSQVASMAHFYTLMNDPNP